jgi:hypothetical protein
MNLITVGSNKFIMLSATFCAVLFALSQNASAARHPLPPDFVSVPDGGATVMLLGVALGALGLARGLLQR